MVALVIAIALLILYGSLYPWKFVPVQLPASPLWILLHSWDYQLDRRFFADVLINVALYAPLGMSAYLAFHRRPTWVKILGPIVIGTVLSASIEMTQLYFPGRNCSGFDLVDNILGSAVGVLLGMGFELLVEPAQLGAALGRIPDRSAVLLLFCWVSSLLFPFFPVMWLSVYRNKFALLAAAPLFSAVPFLTALASWFVAGQLLKAANIASWYLYFSVFLIPLQLFIVDRQPAPAAFLGALIGTAVFSFAERPLRRVIGPAVVLLILFRGFDPFHFGTVHPFQWIPFQGFLEMDWQTGIGVWLEKSFLYGTAVWLLVRAGLRTWVATVLMVTVLLGIEIAQMRIPNRVSEITDPLLALLLAFGLARLGISKPKPRGKRIRVRVPDDLPVREGNRPQRRPAS